MHRLKTIRVGICCNGPVLLSHATKPEWKFVIAICNFEKFKQPNLICCKTTSKNSGILRFGEFIIDNFFNRGKSKIQPTNICRVNDSELNGFKYIGTLDNEHMPKFEKGIKIAIKLNLFEPLEQLNILDSWEPFFII